MKLWLKVLIAMVCGLIFGFIVGDHAAFLKPVGTAFLSLISMVISLLVFASMTAGITSIQDPKKLGRLGGQSMLYYLITTLIAVVSGLAIGYFFQPGSGMNLVPPEATVVHEPRAFSEVLLSLIPKNPIESMATGNVLQIIVFSIFLGFSIVLSGEKGKPLLHVIESLAEVMYKVTSLVMQFSPIGVFAIMAWIAGTFGLEVLVPLTKFIAIYYMACFLFMGVVICGILRFISNLSPLPFFKGMKDAIAMAFSTGSSSATLPISMRCVQENLGVSKNIASFVLPLGTSINMNGTALFQAMSAMFVSQAYGIELDTQAILMVTVTATLASVGTAGVPGSGLIMLSAVLASAGLPLEGIAILAGIDRLRDMIGTVVNVLADALITVAVAQAEGELDTNCYYQEALVMMEGNEVA